MYYKLIQRAFPGWFPYNSLHVMQPFFTKDKNEEIAKKIGTIKLYTKANPRPPPVPKILTKHGEIKKVLLDQQSFVVPWLPALNDLFPEERDFSAFMLSADLPANTLQRNLVGDILYGPKEFEKILSSSIISLAQKYLATEEFGIGGATKQIDILREYVVHSSRFGATNNFLASRFR